MASCLNMRSPFCQVLFILVFLIFCSKVSEGQQSFDRFIRIANEGIQGQMCMGDYGFLWVATRNGLYRFDGRNFKQYRHSSDDSTSISSNAVYAVLPIGDEIWTGTSQGISILNINTHKFRHYQVGPLDKTPNDNDTDLKGVDALFKDKQGEIWVGTEYSGLWKYEKHIDSFIHFGLKEYPRLTPSLYTPERIATIVQSQTNDSIIWGGTSVGLLEVNKYSGNVQFYVFPREDINYQSHLNVFRTLYHHDDGLLYTGGWLAGANVFNPADKTISPLQVKNDPDHYLNRHGIGSFIRKSADEIWITAGVGLFLYSTKEKKILWKKLNNEKNDEFYGMDILDKNGRAWYSVADGIFVSDPFMQQFRTYSFKELVKSSSAMVFNMVFDHSANDIIVCPGSADGLYIFDMDKENWRLAPFENIGSFTQSDVISIRGFEPIGGKNFLLASNKGLLEYDLGNQQLKYVLNDKEINQTDWISLCVDKDGYAWGGTRTAGLFRCDYKTGTYKNYYKELLFSDTESSVIQTLFADDEGNIWIRRRGGFSVYVHSKGDFLNFLYNEDPAKSFPDVRALSEDANGHVWMSGLEGWIGYCDSRHPEKGIIEKINLSELGIDGRAVGMKQDKCGNVWGYTGKYIFKINAEDHKISGFSLEYGNKKIDFYGLQFLPDDQMVIGGRMDITLTHPEMLRKNEELPVPYVTQVIIKNRDQHEAYPLFGGKEFNLKHNENFFSISFSALAYTLGNNVKFRYRLDGFDDWKDAGEALMANYTNVPSGDYTFQLMAANNEGVWNDKVFEIPVNIGQAWYKSWWFISLAILFFVLLGYSFYSYRLNQVRNEERIKADYEKKLASVEMSALLAQMNPHFLFNSLNSIDSYIIKNESAKASEYLNNFARLMRLILQNSRTNFISLKDELEGLELYLQMESFRFSNKFEYNISVDPGIDTEKIEIPPMLIQPYLENAIWHGLMHQDNGKKGKVDLSLHRQNGQLEVIIRDNGIGRKKSAMLKSKKTSAHKQSMGMQITESRIEMINKLYESEASVEITDLYDKEGNAAGTQVQLKIGI